MVFHYLLLSVPYSGIYLWCCWKTWTIFAQRKGLQKFLLQLSISFLQKPQNLQRFLVKLKVYLKNRGFFKNVIVKDVRFALIFQKQIYLNPSRLRGNLRLITTSFIMANVSFINLIVRLRGCSVQVLLLIDFN